MAGYSRGRDESGVSTVFFLPTVDFVLALELLKKEIRISDVKLLIYVFYLFYRQIPWNKKGFYGFSLLKCHHE